MFRVLGSVRRVVYVLSSLSFAVNIHCLRGWVMVGLHVVYYSWLARSRVLQFWIFVTTNSTA